MLASLALADYDARTVAGLAASVMLTEAEVDGVLRRAMALDPEAVHQVVRFRYDSKDGKPAYTLGRRKLSGWKKFSAAVPGLKRVAGVTIG